MIPLRDSIPASSTPFVNYLIIAICGFAFFAQSTSPDAGNTIAEQYGMVPLHLTRPGEAAVITVREPVETPMGVRVQLTAHELAPPALPPWMTLITCMFLHGGLMHFLGNMWFLYIFGDNVEDRFGHLGYAAMYLVTGIVAGLSHLVTNPLSTVPTVGASGAIAGVMGGYLILYPHSKVQAFLPPFFNFVLPAPVFLGIWFVMQTVSGISALRATEATGVAWWAHIGGFVAGAVFALLIRNSSWGRPEVTRRRWFDSPS